MANYVSIWVGNFKNEDAFNQYIEEIYDNEGDSKSKFMEDFNIDFIDNQFQEAVFFNEKIKLEFLMDASYSDSFLNNLSDVDFMDDNSIILLYDFGYNANIKSKNKVRFLGSYSFSK
uniref:immunity 22 family protein n=1 Tax=Flavobacterium sp. TaxID=239 RepID=UPI00404A650C